MSNERGQGFGGFFSGKVFNGHGGRMEIWHTANKFQYAAATELRLQFL